MGLLKNGVEAHDADDKEGCEMGDIAGLLALMQNNKGMDLPGLLALCKDKGYDKAWGGEGMFMFVFLILFLFAGGGWGNLGPNRQQDMASTVAAAGINLQDIISTYDRLAQMQQANSNNFAQLDTKICSSIAETIAAVNSAARSNYDAVRNVGDAVRDCCCTMQAAITSLGCKVDGLYGHTSVLQERTVNEIQKGNCALENRIAALEGKMELGFERTQCLITNTAMQQESARKDREIENLKDTIRQGQIADQAVAKMQAFALHNYKPTNLGTGTATA